MSAGEYVVIQVHGDLPDSVWTDYSRCTADQAVSFMASARASRSDKGWRPVHWIYKEVVLTPGQLDAMAKDTIGKYADKPPATVEISEEECRLLGEVLFNALEETPESQWSDYAGAVATLRKIAPVHILAMWDARP